MTTSDDFVKEFEEFLRGQFPEVADPWSVRPYDVYRRLLELSPGGGLTDPTVSKLMKVHKEPGLKFQHRTICILRGAFNRAKNIYHKGPFYCQSARLVEDLEVLINQIKQAIEATAINERSIRKGAEDLKKFYGDTEQIRINRLDDDIRQMIVDLIKRSGIIPRDTSVILLSKPAEKPETAPT